MLSAYYSRGCDSRELFAPLKISEDPHFSEKLNRDKGDLLFVGINYDEKEKTHTCAIERLQID